MKEDKLKDFIVEHKEEFESEFPSQELWAKIESDLDRKERKVFSIQKFLPYAAAIGLIALSVLFFFNEKNEQLTAEPFEKIQDNVVSDFGEVEAYYVMQVNDKLRDLSQYDIDPELMAEIDELKSEFDNLKIDMGYGADPAIVLEAMIENYRLRLEILEDLKAAFDESKKIKNEIIQ